jgi:serine protease
VSPTSLNFGNYLTVLPFMVSNGGTGTLTVTSVTVDAPWLSAAPTSGEAPLTVEVTIDQSGLADGLYTGSVQIETDASDGSSSAAVDISMIVGGPPPGDVGPTIVQVLGADGSEIIASVAVDSSLGYYTTPAVPPGTYIVTAGTDRDGDSVICDIEDACIYATRQVTVDANGNDLVGADIMVIGGVGHQIPPIENE